MEDEADNSIPDTEDPIQMLTKKVKFIIENKIYHQNSIDYWITSSERSMSDIKNTVMKYYAYLTVEFSEEIDRCIIDKNEEFKQIAQFLFNESKICSQPTLKAAEEANDSLAALLDRCYEVLAAIQGKKEICQQKNDNEACVQVQLQPLYQEVAELEDDYDDLKDDILQIRKDYMLCAARLKTKPQRDRAPEVTDTFAECLEVTTGSCKIIYKFKKITSFLLWFN